MSKFEEYRTVLFNMNHDMLGLGAPIEKDDQGYNRPDFCRMENLGYYPEVLLNESHCKAILRTLAKYKNTQLNTVSDKLTEIEIYFAEEYPDTMPEDDVPVYLDGTRRVSGILLNHFTPDQDLYWYVNDTEYGKWLNIKGQKRLEVKWETAEEMLKAFKNRGFITDRLEELIKEGKPEKNEGTPEGPLVEVLGSEDGFMFLKTGYDAEMVKFVRNASFAKTVKFNDEWAVKAPIHGSDPLLEKYRQAGYDVSAVEALIAETPAVDIPKEKVKVERTEDGYMYLSYPYNWSVLEFTRSNKQRFNLIKEGSGYLLVVNPYDMDDLMEIFKSVGFSTDEAEETAKVIKDNKEPVKLDIVHVHDGQNVLKENHVSILSNGFLKNGASQSRKGNTYVIEDEQKLYAYLKENETEYSPKHGLKAWMKKMDDNDKTYPLIYPETRPFEPYNFQIEDIESMLRMKKCLLANDMGCGKTMESVWVGLSLPFSKLVICPPSLRLNWVKEIKNFAPDADVEIIYSNTPEVKEHEWMVIGYPSVVKHLEALMDMNIRCVMADEAHFIKAVNAWGKPTSKRAEAVLALTANADYRYAITGTPKTSRNKDLYNLLRFIGHPIGSWKFVKYAERYCDGYQNSFGYNFEGNSHDRELNELISPYMIRHLKKEVLPDLKKIRQAIPISTNIREYCRYLKKALEEMRKNNNKANNPVILAYLTKARQSLAISKVPETYDMAETIVSGGESICIATCFKDVIEGLEKKFKDECVKIVGGMTDAAKQKAIDEFQSGKKPVILLNMQAGGVGITLTKSHIMIFNDFPWTTGELTQMEDRICRSGQNETCMIYYMVSEGVEMEEKLAATLTRKSYTINAAIDNGAGEDINIIDLICKTVA